MRLFAVLMFALILVIGYLDRQDDVEVAMSPPLSLDEIETRDLQGLNQQAIR